MSVAVRRDYRAADLAWDDAGGDMAGAGVQLRAADPFDDDLIERGGRDAEPGDGSPTDWARWSRRLTLPVRTGNGLPSELGVPLRSGPVARDGPARVDGTADHQQPGARNRERPAQMSTHASE